MIRNLALAVMLLPLSACVSLGGAEAPASLLTLTSDRMVASGALTEGAMASAIIVDEPEAERRLDVPRIPVQVNDSSIAYVKDAIWVDKPTRLIRQLLIETLSARTGRLVVNGTEAAGANGPRLSGQLVEFGVDAATNEAVMIFDAVRRDGDGKISKRRFEARESVSVIEAGPVGAALNRNANKVAAAVAEWMG